MERPLMHPAASQLNLDILVRSDKPMKTVESLVELPNQDD